jgi:adenine C2-methylase RlmN of 23S rRNA A2503 and tRNA A37
MICGGSRPVHVGHSMLKNESKFGKTANWNLLERRSSSQAYLSRNWNFEDSERLVLTDGFKVVEASVFRHSLDGKHVKTVIELPTSFGCQLQCPHCASGDIARVRGLSCEELKEVYSIASSGINGQKLISFSGIGECSLNEREVFAFVRYVSREDTVTSTLTTVGIRPDFIAHVDDLALEVPIKLLQVSIFSGDVEKVRRFMGPAFAKYDIENLVVRLIKVVNAQLRANVVLISGLNESSADWAKIAHQLDALKSRISIRVSLLNETNVSRKNGIRPSSRERVVECASWFIERGFQAYPFMSTFNDNMNCGQLVWDYEQSGNLLHKLAAFS